MPAKTPGADAILDAALAIAEGTGWSRLRLGEVARALRVPTAHVRRHYRDKDALADAWLARADAAMLADPGTGFRRLPARERIHRVIMRWLEALAPYRRLTGEMLREKLYPGHPHHNLALLGALSRTVQWIREAALLDAPGKRRQVEEIGLTALFVATVAVWLRDDTPDRRRTHALLSRRLAAADRLMARLWPVVKP